MEHVSGLAYSLTLKMEKCSSKTVDFQQSTQHFIPEDSFITTNVEPQIPHFRFSFSEEASSLSGYLHIMLRTTQNKLIHAADEEHSLTASMTRLTTAKYRDAQQQKV
jgi:hypothetical protein